MALGGKIHKIKTKPDEIWYRYRLKTPTKGRKPAPSLDLRRFYIGIIHNTDDLISIKHDKKSANPVAQKCSERHLTRQLSVIDTSDNRHFNNDRNNSQIRKVGDIDKELALERITISHLDFNPFKPE